MSIGKKHARPLEVTKHYIIKKAKKSLVCSGATRAGLRDGILVGGGAGATRADKVGLGRNAERGAHAAAGNAVARSGACGAGAREKHFCFSSVLRRTTK